MLTKFKLDATRDALYPSIQCYQMPLAGIVDEALTDGQDSFNDEELPSWAKFVANPLKSSGFFRYMLEAIFDGKHNQDALHTDQQVGNADRRVSMMFLPANTRCNPKGNEQQSPMQIIEDIAVRALPNFEVIVLNGKTTSNRLAQKKVEEVLATTDSNVLIIAAQMAQRSFSIPEITELFLAYDNGDNGATVQKMSRTLTPSGANKVGRIFSLSFDPNRDDKFDALVVGAAMNMTNKNDKDIKENMRTVMRSVDIFKCTNDGPVLFDAASFIAEALERKAISRVLGKIADVSKLTDSIRASLANGKISVQKLSEVTAAARGKTFSTPLAKVLGASVEGVQPSEQELAKVREMITTIIENLDILTEGTGTTNIAEAINTVSAWGEVEEAFVEEEFGVSFDVIKFLFEQGIINQNIVNLKMQEA